MLLVRSVRLSLLLRLLKTIAFRSVEGAVVTLAQEGASVCMSGGSAGDSLVPGVLLSESVRCPGILPLAPEPVGDTDAVVVVITANILTTENAVLSIFLRFIELLFGRTVSLVSLVLL